MIVEPVAGQHGPGPARAEGFLAGLRAACDRVGALLLFDEVITGFRLCRGGAEEWFGVRPDLWCFGKVIGGGLPVGAFGGSADGDGAARPARPRVPGGHAVGEPARHRGRPGRAWPSSTRPPTDGSTTSPPAWPTGWSEAIAGAGVAVQVPRVGPLVGLFFADRPVRRLRRRPRRGGERLLPPFFHAMLRQGIALAPGAYEVIFPSLAHSDDDLERTFEAAAIAAAEVAAGR